MKQFEDFINSYIHFLKDFAKGLSDLESTSITPNSVR